MTFLFVQITEYYEVGRKNCTYMCVHCYIQYAPKRVYSDPNEWAFCEHYYTFILFLLSTRLVKEPTGKWNASELRL